MSPAIHLANPTAFFDGAKFAAAVENFMAGEINRPKRLRNRVEVSYADGDISKDGSIADFELDLVDWNARIGQALEELQLTVLVLEREINTKAAIAVDVRDVVSKLAPTENEAIANFEARTSELLSMVSEGRTLNVPAATRAAAAAAARERTSRSTESVGGWARRLVMSIYKK